MDDRVVYDLIWQRHALPITALAQELRVIERLLAAPMTIEDVAEMLQVEGRAAEAMLAVLAAVGLLTVDQKGRYEATEITRAYLGNAGPYAYGQLLPGDDHYLTRLRQLFAGGGGPIDPTAVNMGERTADETRAFIHQMHRLTRPAATALATHPIFRNKEHLLDVAGGSGSLSIAIATQHSALQVTLLDLPTVCGIADENIATAGLKSRVHTRPTDMFSDAFPDGSDAILFGNIFHDWDLNACRVLAERAFDALEPGGHILLHEMPLNDLKDGPLTVACFTVSMLIYEKGKQYTRRELQALLSSVGFVHFESTPTFGYYHLIQAEKPR